VGISIIPKIMRIFGYNGTNYYPIRYEHHEVHEGAHYFTQGYQVLTQDQVLDFTWLMPNTTKWIHWTWELDVEAETLWHVYENATASNPLDNTITPFNNNRNSGNSSGTVLKYEVQADIDAANTDTAIGGATLLSEGIAGAGKKAGGSTKRSNELIMDQNILYCLRVVATEAGYINFDMEWYEHTSKDV